MRALQQQGISVLEMPLVETIPGPDRDQLPAVLQEGAFDWVIITSPEAAAVFLKGWEAAGQPEVCSPRLQCHLALLGQVGEMKHTHWDHLPRTVTYIQHIGRRGLR